MDEVITDNNEDVRHLLETKVLSQLKGIVWEGILLGIIAGLLGCAFKFTLPVYALIAFVGGCWPVGCAREYRKPIKIGTFSVELDAFSVLYKYFSAYVLVFSIQVPLMKILDDIGLRDFGVFAIAVVVLLVTWLILHLAVKWLASQWIRRVDLN